MSLNSSSSSQESWRTRVLSHVGGPATAKKIGKDAGIAAVFAIGGWLTSDSGPLKDASPNTKRILNAAFGAPMLAKMELPELQKTWKEREVPDFVMHGLTTAIATMGIATNDHDMITSAAMLSTLFSMAGHLEDGVQMKSLQGVKALEKTVPTTATMHDTGKVVPVHSVKVDEHVRVANGEALPVDGIVSGIQKDGVAVERGAIRMPKALTGEDKQLVVTLGKPLPQGAVATEGTHLVVQAKALAADSAISRNIHYLTNEAEHVQGKTAHSITGGIKNIYVPIMLAACAGEFAWSYYKHEQKHKHPEKFKGKKDISVEKLIAEKLGFKHDEKGEGDKKKHKEENHQETNESGEKDEEKKKKHREEEKTPVSHVRKSIKRTAELAIKMAPCAIMASMLVIPFVKNALAAKHGVMIRDDAALEKMKGITHVLSDIRGTLTKGVSAFKGLHIWDDKAGVLKVAEGHVQHELLGMMGKAQTASTHEIADSVRIAATEAKHSITLLEAEKAVSVEARGVVGNFQGGHELAMGAEKLFEIRGHRIPEGMLKALETHEGDVSLFRHEHGGQVRYGIANFKDELRPGVKEAIQEMRNNDIKVVLVTGMPKKSAEAVMKELETGDALHNPIELRAGCEALGSVGKIGKDDVVREFSEAGHVIAGIGDAHNDATFMQAVKHEGGIAMAIAETGAAATKDKASMVIEGIHQLPDLMKLSRNLNHALWLNVAAAASWMSLLVGSHFAGVHMKTQTASLAHEVPTFLLTLASLGQSLRLAKGAEPIGNGALGKVAVGGGLVAGTYALYEIAKPRKKARTVSSDVDMHGGDKKLSTTVLSEGVDASRGV